MYSVSCSLVLGLLLQVIFSEAFIPSSLNSKESLIKKQSRSEAQSYEQFGCYNDTAHKVLTVFLGEVSTAPGPLRACASIVKERQYKVFGVQNGKGCWSGSASPEVFYAIKRASHCNVTHGGLFFVDVYVFSDVNVPCPVGTRRDLNPYCKTKRDQDLEKNKLNYKLGPTFLNLFPSLNVTIAQLKDIYKNDSVNAEWLTVYEQISRRNLFLLYAFFNQTKNQPEFAAIDDYKNVLKFFIESQYSPKLMPKEYRKFFKFYFLESDEPFERLTRLCNWREDSIFTDQRLAGGNPMSIQRVTIGMK
ncbi:uncharacterized protein LOC116301056, partial [Actinia tenebrosa]|uniref:Uncharacterized protein LOC116301056 n=1 Tax=Actinia tenebrosa TaxID=6105 RepID=A0A6P8IGR5_ACTTE